MQANTELTTEEKARLMHNYNQRLWYQKNKEKAKQSRIKSLAKKYDQMIDQIIDDFEKGGEDK